MSRRYFFSLVTVAAFVMSLVPARGQDTAGLT